MSVYEYNSKTVRTVQTTKPASRHYPFHAYSLAARLQAETLLLGVRLKLA